MTRIAIYALVAFMTISPLLGMEAEVNSLAKAAAEAAEKAARQEAGLRTEAQIHLIAALDQAKEKAATPEVMAYALRPRLEWPELEHFTPVVIDAMVAKFKIPRAQAVALLNLRAADIAFMQELELEKLTQQRPLTAEEQKHLLAQRAVIAEAEKRPFTEQAITIPRETDLQKSTKEWIAKTLNKLADSRVNTTEGEEHLLQNLLRGIRAPDVSIPPFMKVTDALDAAQNAIPFSMDARLRLAPQYRALNNGNTDFITFLKQSGFNINQQPYSYPQYTLLEYATENINPYSLLTIRKLLQEGATLSDNLVTYGHVVLNNLLKNQREDSVAVLKLLLEENQRGTQVHFNPISLITELNQMKTSELGRVPLPPELWAKKMALLQQYVPEMNLIQQYAPQTTKGIWPWSK